MRRARVRAAVVCVVLVATLTQAERVTRATEASLYGDPIQHAEQSAYQRIVVTRGKSGFALFLNNNLQFASTDERRYHEALVHPAFAAVKRPVLSVLIAGGGDGLAAREVLRYPSVERVVLVDLDPAMTSLARKLPELDERSAGALRDPRVTVVNADAMTYLADASSSSIHDVVLVDFPDPNNLALGKLYTTRFYHLARARLAPGGAMAVQATSPLYSRASFWCIARTMEAAGLSVHPYHAFVPAFGEWGFVLARSEPFDAPTSLVTKDLATLDDDRLVSLFRFPKDMARVDMPINRLETQVLVRTYEREIGRYAAN